MTMLQAWEEMLNSWTRDVDAQPIQPVMKFEKLHVASVDSEFEGARLGEVREGGACMLMGHRRAEGLVTPRKRRHTGSAPSA
jgi:hypothetical protein